MNRTPRTLEGRASRGQLLTPDEAEQRVNDLTREATRLEDMAHVQADGRDSSYAAACAGEAAAIRRDIETLSPLMKNSRERLS